MILEMVEKPSFEVKEDGSLFYKDRVCVPNDYELKKAILEDMLNGSCDRLRG